MTQSIYLFSYYVSFFETDGPSSQHNLPCLNLGSGDEKNVGFVTLGMLPFRIFVYCNYIWSSIFH
jgi:hypothetical protein